MRDLPTQAFNGDIVAQGLIRSLLADPAFVPGLRGIYDARYAEPGITVMQIAEVASEAKQLLDRGFGRLAIVAQSQTTYRVAKTFSILAWALGLGVDVFREPDDAEAWLENNGGDEAEPGARGRRQDLDPH